MQVIWETRAENDLAEYQQYVHQFNPKASIDVVDRIFGCVDAITEQPLMGKPGRIAETRELVIPGLHVSVIYRVQEDSLIIVTIHHHRRKRC